MRCKARYRGYRPVLGAEKGNVYTLEMSTVLPGQTSPSVPSGYMWVRVEELPEYCIPYEGMLPLLAEWEFIAGEHDVYARHLELVDAWLDLYAPEEVGAE